MKTLYALTLFLFAMSLSAANAQDTSRADLAVGYTYIHSNAPPSGCGCFNWNGGLVSTSWKLNPKWAVTGEFAGAHASKLATSNLSPDIVTFLAGPRYSLTTGSHRTTPFANILVGGAHSSNGYYPTGTTSSTSATSFAMAAGGGIDFTVGRHVAIRALEAEYLLTLFPNAVNDRQNNFRITSGIVFRFKQR